MLHALEQLAGTAEESLTRRPAVDRLRHADRQGASSNSFRPGDQVGMAQPVLGMCPARLPPIRSKQIPPPSQNDLFDRAINYEFDRCPQRWPRISADASFA
jgi:hypothetical protein